MIWTFVHSVVDISPINLGWTSDPTDPLSSSFCFLGVIDVSACMTYVSPLSAPHTHPFLLLFYRACQEQTVWVWSCSRFFSGSNRGFLFHCCLFIHSSRSKAWIPVVCSWFLLVTVAPPRPSQVTSVWHSQATPTLTFLPLPQNWGKLSIVRLWPQRAVL